MRARASLAGILIAGLATLSIAAPLEAQRRPRRPLPTPPPAEARERAIARLASEDPAELRSAIDALARIDGPEVVAPIAELIRAGQVDAVTDHAIEALGTIAEPSALEVLVEMTRHRRAAARQRAYAAIARLPIADVATHLERGLGDGERMIRNECALAIANLRAPASLEVLFVAFERGVFEASTAIGRIGDGESAARFSGFLGRLPLAAMLAGYGEYLARQDIPEPTKVEIVQRLGRVAGPAVRAFLVESLPASAGAELRQVMEETIRSLPTENDRRRTRPVDECPEGETCP